MKISTTKNKKSSNENAHKIVHNFFLQVNKNHLIVACSANMERFPVTLQMHKRVLHYFQYLLSRQRNDNSIV